MVAGDAHRHHEDAAPGPAHLTEGVRDLRRTEHVQEDVEGGLVARALPHRQVRSGARRQRVRRREAALAQEGVTRRAVDRAYTGAVRLPRLVVAVLVVVVLLVMLVVVLLLLLLLLLLALLRLLLLRGDVRSGMSHRAAAPTRAKRVLTYRIGNRLVRWSKMAAPDTCSMSVSFSVVVLN